MFGFVAFVWLRLFKTLSLLDLVLNIWFDIFSCFRLLYFSPTLTYPWPPGEMAGAHPTMKSGSRKNQRATSTRKSMVTTASCHVRLPSSLILSLRRDFTSACLLASSLDCFRLKPRKMTWGREVGLYDQ